MSLESMTNPGGRTRSRSAIVLGIGLMALIPAVANGAPPSGQAPRFEGKPVPDPPHQGQPWQAPATKLPKFLVDATATLFEQGVADPRGCEYRAVELGQGVIVKAHGFVLPEQPDAPGRFVVCWDGLVYPAMSVGHRVDLEYEIKSLAAHVQGMRDAGKLNRFRQGVSWSFPREGTNPYGDAGVNDQSPIKICLLLRLGRADLAELLFAAGTTWTPGARTRDLTDYHISYLTLAVDWAQSAFGRLITAHSSGNDALALDSARRLSKFRDLTTAKADAMGFPHPVRQDGVTSGPPPRFSFLKQLDDLFRDHERRAKQPARGPIPKKRGEPSARIAALIRDLDQIDERQWGGPGATRPGDSALVRELVAEGDLAVEPLLKVLESDDRLTRSVSHGRGFAVDCFIHPVYEPAFVALTRILRTQEFEERVHGWKLMDSAARKDLADSIRKVWEKTRSVPLVDRWYRTLLDEAAGSARWLEAAGGIVQPAVTEGMPAPKPGTQPLQGEPLRVGREPSVTSLLLRRAAQLERGGDPQSSHDPGFRAACQMAQCLVTWDEQAALPLLKDLCKKCRTRSDRWRDQQISQDFDSNLTSTLAQFTLTRVRLGDDEALEEYAGWLRTTTPTMLNHGKFAALEPLLRHPDHPALASAARWLFNDPNSPWGPLIPEAGGKPASFHKPFIPVFIVVDGFREGVLAGLADKAPLGTLVRKDQRTFERRLGNTSASTYSSTNFDLEGVVVGVEYPVRRCDYLAWFLSGLEGSPRFGPFWAESRRDEAVAAYVAYLMRYGERFTTEAPAGAQDWSNPKAYLKFPTLEKPATPDDVASARAIFSLESEAKGNEVRVVRLPECPQPARWVTLKNDPMDRIDSTGRLIRRDYDNAGFVWQVEEVRKGDTWERYYGFVGHHVIARAPASEIEFGIQYTGWGNLKEGLDVRFEPSDSRKARYESGRPIVLTLKIRNRLGVSRSSPTEFVRPAPDGKPALRNGVSLRLRRSTPHRPKPLGSQGFASEGVALQRDAHFEPGDADRLLAPLEAFDAAQLDLNDWFDLSEPGNYALQLNCSADSGVGEGRSTEFWFEVAGEE